MNPWGLLFLIVARLMTVTVKMAFTSVSRVDLRQLVHRNDRLAGLLGDRTRFQFSLLFWDELTLLALILAAWGAIVPVYGWSGMWIAGVVYLAVEKLLVSIAGFISREWMLERLVLAYRPIHFLLMLPLLPAIWIADRLINLEDARQEDEEEREEEERAFIDVATEDGIIEEEEKELIQGVLDFGETVVREVMTPRTDIVAAPEDASFGSLVEIFREAKHSRIPVYRESIDDIVGVIHLKDLIQTDAHSFAMGASMKKPFYVPETKNVAELLREMQKARTKMAIILDEYGGTAGIVTIEDLVEEIVGEIEDEHDAMHVDIRKVAPETWQVDGKCNLETLEEQTGISLDLDEVDTVGGAVFSVFGRVPEAGESAVFGDWRITVEAMDRRRVVSVRMERVRPDDVSGPEDRKP